MAQAEAPVGAELTGSEKYVIAGVSYTVHPAAALFPLVEGTEFEQAVADAKARGIMEPVRHVGREIVDGRNRVRWALAAGVDIPLFPLEEGVDVYEFIASKNLHRRHLKASQKAAIGAGLVRLAEDRRREERALRDAKRRANQRAAPAGADGETSPDASGDVSSAAAGGPDAAGDGSGAALPPEPESPVMDTKGAAQALGVSETSINRVGQIIKKAPELAVPLRDGTLSINEGKQLLLLPEKKRKKIMEAVSSGRYPSVAEALKRFGAPAQSRGKPAPKSAAGSGGDAASEPASGLPDLPSVGGAAGAAAPGSPSAPDPAAKGQPGPSDARPSAPAGAAGSDAPPPKSFVGSAGGPDPDQGSGSPPAGAGPDASPARAGAAPAPAIPPPPEGLDPVAPEVALAADFPPDLLSPEPVITAVREIYGSIALDPCSMDLGQDRVRAKGWFGADELPLQEPWKDKVYIFPPGPMTRQFAGKLRSELDRNLREAIFLGPLDLSERWVGEFLDHHHFSALILSRKLVEFDVAGQKRRWRAPMPLAVYLFGADATAHQLAQAFGFWGRVLVSAREK